MTDISKCQYCFLSYEECTCCKYCSGPKGTCECHLEGDYPCTKFHPSEAYKKFYKDPEFCKIFDLYTLDDIDHHIKKMYRENFWPERLKK